MTLAAITMTAPEAASPVQMYRATYSPDDNKLRLYAVSRLDPETYKKVHDAGFRWAPKQALFVAPAWTPGREDVLLSLAGEIEDEDSTLAERQEARAERFTGYSGKRASESAQALDEVERLAAMIPPGQPILVGHHSERRARRDAQRIENGMKRAVMLFERAEYWEERARSALLHAKYKERPDVRWRRIKKIEADLRKAEKTIAQSQKYLTMWRAESLDLNMAKLISSHDHISACFPLDTYPRPAEKSQYEGSRSLWSALDDDIITTEQAREIAIRCHERQIQHQQRWVNHYQNRLIYERAMLDESGGVVTRTQDFEPGGQVFSRGEWLTIIRVNKSNGAVSSVTTPNYLHREGKQINHKAVQRLMGTLSLKAAIKVKRYRSYRGEVGQTAPNVLQRDFKATRPNEKWVTDVTEFAVNGRKLYLSPVIDLFNNEVISYSLSERPVMNMVENMLDQAFKKLNPHEHPVLHSDQGWQYRMRRYQNILKEHGIKQSMSRKGNCLDNAVVECFFGTLKSECFYLDEFSNISELKDAVTEYIEYYNSRRISLKLKGLTPIEYRNQTYMPRV